MSDDLSTTGGFTTAITRSIRSEAVRLRRSWKLPLVALALTVLATVLSVSAGGDFGPGAGGGGASAGGGNEAVADTPVADTAIADTAAAAQPLEAADGILAGLEMASTFVALIALVLWALSVSRDLQTGSIRVLLVTEARRSAYLGGKLLALAGVTIAMAVVCGLISVLVSYPAAAAAGIATDAWAWSSVGSALVNLALASLLWGSIGGVVAVATRSAAGAIAGGLGYLVLGENLLGLLWDEAGNWLPAGTVDTLIAGGSATVTYGQALALGLGYLVAGIGASLVLLARRDISD